MNKNSIFFKITIFFGLLIVLIHMIIYLGYTITLQQQNDILVSKYLKTLHRIHKPPFEEHPPDFQTEDFNHFPPPHNPPKPHILTKPQMQNALFQYDLELSTISYETIKTNGDMLVSDRDWELYVFEGYKYFYFKDRFEAVLIKDTIQTPEKTKYIIGLTILLNLILILFYLFLLKKLAPLKKLKNDIMKFADGDLEINTASNSKDEISEVSNEFNNAIEQIRILTTSRNLFLRNIMHELKTPITKGLLISNMLEDSKFKTSLKKAFFRLEFLLNEFAKVEQFTSKNIKLDKKDFMIEEILDNAIDMLYLTKDDFDVDIKWNTNVNVDFDAFSIVIKNLLDNAIKYGTSKPCIVVTKERISVSNQGGKLAQNIYEYNKPFNKKYENSSSGLGLGLYIVNSILKAHNLVLEYDFDDGKNTFMIRF